MQNFTGKKAITPVDISETLSLRFRQYLLDRLNGETPACCFARYKRVLKAATKDGYFRHSPSEDIAAKANKNKRLKENLEADEYLQLLNTPCINYEVREAFILCCYTALRWCDVKVPDWKDIRGDQLKTKIIQGKTGEPLAITLHPIAKAILEKRSKKLATTVFAGKVFNLPMNNGANKVLGEWCRNAGIKKHITWHCARLSFSILLQDANVDDATVALLLGHTTTKYVHQTYKRHRPKDQTAIINKLPNWKDYMKQ